MKIALLLCISALVLINCHADDGFSVDTAKRFLYYSYAAYCPAPQLMNWDCKWCNGPSSGMNVSAIVVDKPTDTTGFIGYNSHYNEVVLSFRGTVDTSIQDWIDDLKVWKADTPFDGIANAYVAEGFYDCWKGLGAKSWAAVQSTMKAHPGARLFVTGHSLGGALATLATLDFVVNKGVGSSGISAFTFGSPRVGDSTFAGAYNKRGIQTYRMTNHHDIVPHVPFSVMSFQHVVTEVWENDNNYKVCSSAGPEDPTCANSVAVPDSVYDHLHYMGFEEGC